jgi:uncharacterized cupin superfamily protein
MPKIDLASAPVRVGSDYPAPYATDFAQRRRVRLGDAAGLTQFGVNLATLPAGSMSSLRHWHEVEEEMVVVLEGTLTLVEDGGESALGPGDVAGFPAGIANGHHLVNRTDRPAVFLEIGTRPDRDRCHYADVDMIAVDENGATRYVRRDGSPYEAD